MPLKAIDYKKSVIYTIKTGDSVYVGSTTNFTTRKGQHKHNIYNQNSNKYNLKLYKTIRDNDWNWDMKPYKEYPCENKTQLIIEEERIRCDLNSDLNINSCGTGLSREEYDKQYRNKNKDKIVEQKKQNYIQNKDKLLEQQKQYNFKNKDKISEQKRQKTTCQCGCIVNKSDLPRHKKSNKHIKLMEKK